MQCQLLSGPVRDFNVFVDRRYAAAEVVTLRLVAGEPL